MSEGDPVDVATGDVMLAETDVTLPGVLPVLSGPTGRWPCAGQAGGSGGGMGVWSFDRATPDACAPRHRSVRRRTGADLDIPERHWQFSHGPADWPDVAAAAESGQRSCGDRSAARLDVAVRAPGRVATRRREQGSCRLVCGSPTGWARDRLQAMTVPGTGQRQSFWRLPLPVTTAKRARHRAFLTGRDGSGDVPLVTYRVRRGRKPGRGHRLLRPAAAVQLRRRRAG